MYLSKDGFFKVNALKTATVFSDYPQTPLFSPMYRLKAYTGELPDAIRIFKKISDGLKNPGNADAYPSSLGNILWENLYNFDETNDGVSESELDEIWKGALKNGIQRNIPDKSK